MITIKVGKQEYQIYIGANLEAACSTCGGQVVFDMYTHGVRAKARNKIERMIKAGVKPVDIRKELENWNAGTKSEQSVKRVQNVKDSIKGLSLDQSIDVAGYLAGTIKEKK